MSNVTVYLVDAFTKTPGQGNRAGVVLDADGLDAEQMQAIAHTINVSETAFVLSSNAKDYDLEVRYFTPMREVPICGHATIATHWMRAQSLGLGRGELRVKTGVGILPVAIDRISDAIQITMTQGRPTLDPPFSPKICRDIGNALGIGAADLDPRLPIQIASTGHSKIMIPIRDKAVLDHLTPDMKRLRQISEDVGCNGFFAFTLKSERNDVFLAGRMFAPAIGIEEDPVTGNANGPAAYYLHSHGLLPFDQSITYSALQGEAMGKPGIIQVKLIQRQEEAVTVQIIGSAVLAGEMIFEVVSRPTHSPSVTLRPNL